MGRDLRCVLWLELPRALSRGSASGGSGIGPRSLVLLLLLVLARDALLHRRGCAGLMEESRRARASLRTLCRLETRFGLVGLWGDLLQQQEKTGLEEGVWEWSPGRLGQGRLTGRRLRDEAQGVGGLGTWKLSEWEA